MSEGMERLFMPTVVPDESLVLDRVLIVDHGDHQVIVAGLCNGIWIDFKVCQHPWWNRLRWW